MNGDWGDVQNLLDLVDHLWIGIVIVVAAAIPSWFAARNHKGIKKVQDQVVNGHKTPMREDLDSVRDLLNKMGDNFRQEMRFIRVELSDIRSDLSIERNDRINLDKRFEDHRRKEGREQDS